ncbi:MAG: thiol:disulfide interchange protein DsbD [Oleiphilaceae bacterium]|jgi:thiol:disulfide interchange protein DsbD
MLNNARYKQSNSLFSQLIIAILLFSVLVGSSSAEGLNSLLDKGSQADVGQSEFLKVDEAFEFQSELTDKGIKLSWKIAPHYYLYFERFKFKAANELTTLGEPQFSQKGDAKEDPYFGLVHVIHDELEVFLPIALAENISEDEIKVSYQGCAEAGLCYPPKKQNLLFTQTNNDAQNLNPSKLENNTAEDITLTDDLEDASSVFNFISNSSLPLIIGIFFLLGLGLTFTPCVFPMIPIIASIVAGQEKPTMSKSLALSSAYVLGMALTYALAGVITGLLGAGANIQAALQNPYILSFFASIFVLLSLAMFGLYELQLPAFIRDKLNNTSQNLSGGHISSVFFIGALSALVVSPCVSAPLAGALIYISSTGDAVIGGASLFALGLGMGVPLIIIAVTGSKFLPKSGQWMNRVKYVFGIMLLAVAIWLLSRTLPAQVSMILWALLIGLTATQMGAFDSAKAGWPRMAKGLGLILALYSAILIIGALSGAHDPFKPLANFTGDGNNLASTSKLEHVQFNVVYDQEGLEKERLIAKNAVKPMLVDFYADWCISCVVMENTVFPLPEIKTKLELFHLVKADVTENSEANQELLDSFGLFGPPSILLYDAKGEENKILRIVGEIHKDAFEKRLIKALER